MHKQPHWAANCGLWQRSFTVLSSMSIVNTLTMMGASKMTDRKSINHREKMSTARHCIDRGTIALEMPMIPACSGKVGNNSSVSHQKT